MKKNLKYIALGICLLSFVSCSTENDGDEDEGNIEYINSASPAEAEYTYPDLDELPTLNDGSATLELKDCLTDHIYVYPSDDERKGSISASFTPVLGEYLWYTKNGDDPDSEWTEISGETGKTLSITIPAGESTTYYALRHTYYEGRLYSNICTVKSSYKFDKIGYLAYADGTCSSSYTKTKTLLGVVYDVDEEGNPVRYTDYKKLSSDNLSWAKKGSTGASALIKTSFTDGSLNWDIIKEADSEGAASAKENYPAFAACSEKTTGGKSWYLPARDELVQMSFNKDMIDKGLKTAAKKVSVSYLTGSGSFWSSSQSLLEDDSTYAWAAFIGTGNAQLKNTKTISLGVRAVGKF